MKSKYGLTMFCSIHQPAPEILEMFDDALFMAHGMIVYHGPLNGVLKKNFLKKIFGYEARYEFWLKIGLRFWILVGYVIF